MLSLIVLCLLCLSTPAFGHGYIKQWTVNGVTALAQKTKLAESAFRSVSANTGWCGSDFLTNPCLTCGAQNTPFNVTAPATGPFFSDASQAAGTTLNTPSGATVQLVVAGPPGIGWPHKDGMIQTYLGLCGTGPGDCQTFDASQAKWFKIQSEINGVTNTLMPAYNSTLDGNPYNVALPSNIPTGSYMLRFEIIAFGDGSSTEDFQIELYPFCGQLYITGSTAASANLANLATVSFPAAYQGLTIVSNTAPGPAVMAALGSYSSASPTPTGGSSGGKKSSKLGTGAIAGIAVGGAAVLLGAVIFAWFAYHRSKTNGASRDRERETGQIGAGAGAGGGGGGRGGGEVEKDNNVNEALLSPTLNKTNEGQRPMSGTSMMSDHVQRREQPQQPVDDLWDETRPPTYLPMNNS